MITRNLQLRSQIQKVLMASALGLALQVPQAFAQTPPAAGVTTEIDTVIVTGTLIRGSSEDAALPIDVITTEDLEEQGSPSVVQLVKTLTASTAAIGESNRYNVGAGTAQINLRGFGAARSLVLMNNRRLVDNPIAAGQNLNFIPSAAVGRLELLKEGAAATYGSDAIGGVINFITRTDLDGLEVDAEYSHIDGSDGDYQGNIAWGNQTGNGNVLLTFGYRHRSRLDIRERDWAHAKYFDPGYGGWTGASNPGIYVENSVAGAALFRDNGCTQLGGVLTPSAAPVAGVAVGQPVGSAAAPSSSPAFNCRFEFSEFNDLVNIENHYQAYGEFNTNLSDTVKSHTEFAWSRDYVPMQRLSPANLTARFPTPITPGTGQVGPGTSGSLATPGALNFFVRYNVPAYNPGLIDLRTVCAAPLTTAQCTSATGMASPNGVDISQTGWRAIAFAGHPTNADKADHQSIDSKAFRVSSSLQGEIWGINWDAAATYMQARSSVSTNDLVVSRLQLALNGFGSLSDAAPCQATTQALRTPANAGNQAIGCYFFNPFTNSVAVSAVNGQANPYYRGNANSNVNNHPKLVEWLYGNYVNDFENEMFVFDGVLSGKTGIELPGGDIAWALGGQYRETRERQAIGDLNNTRVSPCVDSSDDGTPACGAADGTTIFFGSASDSDLSRGVWATFGELNIPVLDSLDLSLALRFESYPGNIGSTTDPKLSVRWQVIDWLALRGSAGTTFRAPGLGATSPNCQSGVANIGGQYRATLTCGNPDLEPETADTYDFGILLNPGNFTASLDYYYFDFTKELTNESVSRLYQTMFNVTTANAAGNDNNCNVAGFAPLQARFSFAGGVCSRANVLRIQSNNVNGPSTKTSGLDARLQYDFKSLLGGSLSVGAEATYLLKYERGAFTLKGAPNIAFAAPEDRAGLHDLVAQFFSYPRLKANVFASFSHGDLTYRLQGRYQEGTEAAFGTPTSQWVTNDGGVTYTQQALGKVDDYYQLDAIVRWQAPWNTTVTGSVQNVLDKEPPFAPSNFNYDYTNGNPLGRVFEINVKKKF